MVKIIFAKIKYQNFIRDTFHLSCLRRKQCHHSLLEISMEPHIRKVNVNLTSSGSIIETLVLFMLAFNTKTEFTQTVAKYYAMRVLE